MRDDRERFNVPIARLTLANRPIVDAILEAPDTNVRIDFVEERVKCTHLRCHPVWCANRRVLPGERRGQMRGHAKVDQLDARFLGQQDIVTLHVAVHAVVTVQEDESFDRLLQDVSYLAIR